MHVHSTTPEASGMYKSFDNSHVNSFQHEAESDERDFGIGSQNEEIWPAQNTTTVGQLMSRKQF